jgi:uncharacterized protein (DUF305 family)
MIVKYALTATAALLIGWGAPAVAQTHQGHDAAKTSAVETAATKAYREANSKMHSGMDIRYSNDADADFIRGMIPHHQGAIDMAKVVLEHGKDEQTRKWATDIIREQQREIAEMQEWLKSRKAQ